MVESSRNDLIVDNMGLVYHVINTYFPKYKNDEDIEQIGMIGLCLAAEEYSADKAVAFSTYACTCIRNEILRELKKEDTKVKTIPLETLLNENSENEPITLSDTITEQSETIYIDWDYYGASNTDKRIIEGLIDGKTNKEIGKDIGLSEASIKKHRAKLDRQRFEDSINIL